VVGACGYGEGTFGFRKAGNLTIAAEPVSFSRRTLLHGVSKVVGVIATII
jgi:hypothetical protein